MIREPKSQKSEQGMGLLSVVMGLGLVSILLLVYMTHVQNSQQSLKKIKIKSNREDLRNFVRFSVSCEKTLNAVSPPVNSGDSVKLIKHNGSTAISLSGSTIGDYTLTAFAANDHSTGTPLEITVKYDGNGDTGNLFAVPRVCRP